MIMPNFLLIGAAKGGTSSMYLYLDRHPEIYMSPIKEPNFFAYEGWQPDYCGPGDADAPTNQLSVTNLKDYQALFEGVNTEKAIGEASTHYLYTPETPERIKHYIPDAKLIAILRQPVERAYSFYLHLRRKGREPLSNFLQALQEEEKRKTNHWAPTWRYKEFGFYSVQLQRYFDRFDRDRIKIYLYEDWQTKPVEVIQDIFRFLGVDDTFVPDMSTRYNTTTQIPKNQSLYNLITKQSVIKDVLRSIIPAKIRQPMAAKVYRKNLEPPKSLAPEIRQQLIPIFKEDILKLQDLIQRDLSHWLE
ncbi:MAG: sulfotransferase [Microcoleaceae cyanobacterium]